MNSFRLLQRLIGRYIIRPVGRYAESTFGVVRLYLLIYIAGLCGSIWFRSSTIAFAAAIACDLLSYVIRGRVMAAGGVTALLLRFLPGLKSAESEEDKPKPGELGPLRLLWYWTSFVQMWVTLPLYALGILEPWKFGLSVLTLSATFMLLHIVDTIKHIGDFWRKVYACIMMGVLATVIFAIADPGDYQSWQADRYAHQVIGRQAASRTEKKADQYRWAFEQAQALETGLVNKREVSFSDPTKAGTWTAQDDVQLEQVRKHEALLVGEMNNQSAAAPPQSRLVARRTLEDWQFYYGPLLIIGLIGAAIVFNR